MATAKQILGKVVITNKGKWNSSNVYEVLDVVSYQGSSYMSKVYDNNSLPTEDSKWQLLAQKGDTYEVSETDIKNIAKQITENANSNFNKNDFKVLEGYYIGTNGNVGQATTNNIIYMPIKSNTSYSIQKVSSNRFRVGTYSNLEVLGKILNNVIKNLDDSIVSYTLNNTNDKYLFFQYLGGDTNEQEILDSIQIEEGSISTKYTDHQESSLTFDIPEREFVGYIDNTYKDELAVIYNVTDGQFHKILKKKVGKLVITDENKNKFIFRF